MFTPSPASTKGRKQHSQGPGENGGATPCTWGILSRNQWFLDAETWKLWDWDGINMDRTIEYLGKKELIGIELIEPLNTHNHPQIWYTPSSSFGAD